MSYRHNKLRSESLLTHNRGEIIETGATQRDFFFQVHQVFSKEIIFVDKVFFKLFVKAGGSINMNSLTNTSQDIFLLIQFVNFY